jgi:hypothetical protein
MFGLSEQELTNYLHLTQDFAIETATPRVISHSKCIIPAVYKDGTVKPDRVYLQGMIHDIEQVITLTAVNMAHEYAHLQSDLEVTEDEIVQRLQTKFEDQLFIQFLKFGVAFTEGIIGMIVGEILWELPFLYVSAIEDEDFDEDTFLEERLAAYGKYIENLPLEIEEESLEELTEEEIAEAIELYERLAAEGDEEEDEEEDGDE